MTEKEAEDEIKRCILCKEELDGEGDCPNIDCSLSPWHEEDEEDWDDTDIPEDTDKEI